MRKVIYTMSVSLDGFIETENKEIDWAIIDEEFHSFANDLAREAGGFLYGRHMYELMVSHWPTAETNPSSTAYEVEFARIWKAKPKIVFSKTLERVEWNSRLIRENIPATIMELKAQPGKDMGLGGADIASTFLQLGLIDEFRLFIHPVVLGRGTPYFPVMNKSIDLKLVDTRTFSSGVVYLDYMCADEAS